MRNFVLALCLAGLVAGCQSTNDLMSGGPAINPATIAILEPQIEVSNDVTTGTAQLTKVLGFGFGDTAVADGVVFGTSSGDERGGGLFGSFAIPFEFLSGLFSADLETVKAAAAYKACEEAGCDILVDPRYNVESTSFWFLFSQATATVRGRPATITGYHQLRRDGYYKVNESGTTSIDRLN